MVVVVGRVYGWEALGKTVLAETEPRSVAEPNTSQSKSLTPLERTVLYEI